MTIIFLYLLFSILSLHSLEMMDFRQLLGGDMAMPAPGQDMESNDTAETIQISSLALLKVKIIG